MHTDNAQVMGTKGRWRGHVFRRLVHLSMLVIPLIYYSYGKRIAEFFSLTPMLFLLALLGLMLLVECIRLRSGILVFGQRKHEAKTISSFSWAVFGVIVVLLVSPSRAFSIPIIWSLAIVDPLLGELRALLRQTWIVSLVGCFAVLAIWWLCGSYWLGLSLWWGILLAPITVAVEWLKLQWIDDNGLMLLVPLAIIIIIKQL